MWAFKMFLDSLPKEKAEKCSFCSYIQKLSHEAGTDLKAVVSELLFGEGLPQCYKI